MPAEIKQQFAIYRRFFSFGGLRLIHHLFFPALRAVYIIKAPEFFLTHPLHLPKDCAAPVSRAASRTTQYSRVRS